jgi:4'-phosphopantetheinyl transferase
VSSGTGSGPAGSIDLSSSAVHVWRFRTDVAEHERSSADALLSPEERDRAERRRTSDARTEFTVARATLRRLLSLYTGLAPERLTFAYSPSGKPAIARSAAISFSLSHADGIALVAIARTAVGVDVETLRPRPRAARIAARFLGDTVSRHLFSLPETERTLAFHRAWTQHEAYVKAVGGELFAFVTPLAFHWPWPTAPVLITAHDGVIWSATACDAGAGRIATVVACGTVDSVVEREVSFFGDAG